MRISELAEQSDVPLATVKYYLREGLLPPGTPVTARLTDYDDTHVRRLRLLKVLRAVGRLPISNLRALVDAVELQESEHAVLGAAADALAPTPAPAGPHRGEAQRAADDLVARAGWRVRPESVDRANLANVIETFIELTGRTPGPETFESYVRVADRMAEWEIASLDARRGREELLQQMVVGQVLLGELFAVTRRLAEESHSARRFSGTDPG